MNYYVSGYGSIYFIYAFMGWVKIYEKLDEIQREILVTHVMICM